MVPFPIHELAFSGKVVERGFWVYIWKVIVPSGGALLYVGVNGDSSSLKAQSPFNRMGQHLGFADNSNMLRTHLGKRGIGPEECGFRLAAQGPIFAEADERETHRTRRDLLAGIERRLIEDLVASGYEVMNVSRSKKKLDEALYEEVREGFAEQFSKLTNQACVPVVGGPDAEDQ